MALTLTLTCSQKASVSTCTGTLAEIPVSLTDMLEVAAHTLMTCSMQSFRCTGRKVGVRLMVARMLQ